MGTRTLRKVTLNYFALDADTILRMDDEFTVYGERGQFVFKGHIITPQGDWIDAFGGTSKSGQFRAFRPERIRQKKRKRT